MARPLEDKIAYTIDELSKVTSIGREKVREIVINEYNKGNLMICKIGRKYIIKRREFENWLSKQKEL